VEIRCESQMLGSIYTKHDLSVALSRTTESTEFDIVRIDPNLAGRCHTTRCNTKVVLLVNTPLDDNKIVLS
jgi:hypothetical protein